jgi:HD-GYP domain-containing protein (c-di-GMP phosphodiesterase class II)
MTSPRPYRGGKSTHDEAIAELKRCAGTQFDPEVVRVFAAQWEAVKPTHTKVRPTGATAPRPNNLMTEDSDVIHAR